MTQESRPGGAIGLVVVLVLFAVGYLFDIEWMRFWGGTCTSIWVFMLVVGFIFGAKR